MTPLVRRIFWILNKFFMVPIFRLGFGPFLGSPFGGYILVDLDAGHHRDLNRFAGALAEDVSRLRRTPPYHL